MNDCVWAQTLKHKLTFFPYIIFFSHFHEVLVWGSSATLDIPTTTMYVNHNPEVLLRWHDCGNYTVPTCNYYSGTHNVKVKLFHPHNPQNDAHHGITYFAVVTKPPSSVSQLVVFCVPT